MKSPLYLAIDTLARLPSGWTERLGASLGTALGSLIRYRREEVLAAMARAFPEWSDDELQATARRMYRNLGLNMGENIRFFCGRADGLLDRVTLVGEERMRAVLEEGRGALALIAHLGNFELTGPKAVASGLPTSVVTKEIKGRMANDFLAQARTRYGVGILPRQNSYRDCLRVLKRNEILGFMLDQNMIRTEGVFVDFLGKPACTTPGLAYLSAQSGAPVVPVFCHRTETGHEIRIGEPFAPPADREPETIREVTQQYSQVLEDAIRENPDQWIWIHRRWRTQPLAYAEDGSTGDRTG